MNDFRLVAAAEAMRLKHLELSETAKPLDLTWYELAYTAVTAFEKASEDDASANLRRLSKGGAN